MAPRGTAARVAGNETITRLLATRRWCYFIPCDGFVEGHGWRPSVVFEGEEGHYPVGDWPYEGRADQKAPWWWGPTYEGACAMADAMNERIGVSKLHALEIVTSSMMVSKEPRRGRRST